MHQEKETRCLFLRGIKGKDGRVMLWPVSSTKVSKDLFGIIVEKQECWSFFDYQRREKISLQDTVSCFQLRLNLLSRVLSWLNILSM